MPLVWYFRALADFAALGILRGDLIIVQPGQHDAVLLVRNIEDGMRGPGAPGDLTLIHHGVRHLVRRLPPNFGLVGMADMDGALRCLNPLPNPDASPWRVAAGAFQASRPPRALR